VRKAVNPETAPDGSGVKEVRAALYLRVSTGRQADNDLSIPDQRRQTENYCASKGWGVAEVYVEPGASAMDDRRPEFQRMIDAALVKGPPFTVIVVHSFSRFFRDQFQLELYVRKLAKNGVRLVSITQALSDDPMGNMIRQIMGMFDEYQSRENGKHTLRAMRENAIQGYWNGARPPLGYRVVAAEQRGAKTKKKLEIDPLHADTVRLIYRLALEGADGSGPLGIKSITTYLNEKGLRTRDGGRFGVASVHQILTRETYIGRHKFNYRDYKTKAPKPEAEHAIMAVDPIISDVDFTAAQEVLKSRNPKFMPPRAVSGPTLLTGICFCAHCGGAMTLRTGKRIYRYYTCSTKARQGETGCIGQSVPMDQLDEAVIQHIEWRLLDPRRLEALMNELLERRHQWAESRRTHIAELRRRATEAEAKLNRLFQFIEMGTVDLSEPVLNSRVVELKALRDQATADADRAETLMDKAESTVTPEMLRAFALAARKKLKKEDGTYRRDHLRALAQRVEVANGTEVRISGSKTELLRTLIACAGVGSAEFRVRGFIPKWRAPQDSNLRPSGSKPDTLSS